MSINFGGRMCFNHAHPLKRVLAADHRISTHDRKILRVGWARARSTRGAAAGEAAAQARLGWCGRAHVFDNHRRDQSARAAPESVPQSVRISPFSQLTRVVLPGPAAAGPFWETFGPRNRSSWPRRAARGLPHHRRVT